MLFSTVAFCSLNEKQRMDNLTEFKFQTCNVICQHYEMKIFALVLLHLKFVKGKNSFYENKTILSLMLYYHLNLLVEQMTNLLASPWTGK